jgi:predicted regulator of Ras-like GTPase activity (Roadblock/LC7/MglB family)
MTIERDISSLVERIQSSGTSALSDDFRAQLNTLLTALVDESSDILGALVTSSDGHAWGQVLPAGFDGKRFAAMSSALMALSDTLAREAKKGPTVNVMVEGMEGNIYVLHAGKNLSLTVFTNIKPNLGLTLAQARRAADRIVIQAREAAERIAGVKP